VIEPVVVTWIVDNKKPLQMREIVAFFDARIVRGAATQQ
jgi:hypothetical protein